ncbi:MAG: ribosome maturation factor RimP [Candidatus Omnitrophica bacterium]|nr:ribosome maturation factor RimP [Candidatus Omnitrophota bacterium]
MIDIIVNKIKGLTAKLLQEGAIELIDIIYRRESGGMVLRFLVDKEGGIKLEECARLNEEISALLDQSEIMLDKYTLEVSSPGLDRPLKTRRDFERVMGKSIRVHTYEPIEGKRRDCEGIVKAVDDEKVTIDNNVIRLDKIAKAKLKIEI